MVYRQQTRRTKYNNEHTEYNGRRYDSKLEAGHAADLDLSRSATNPRERVAEVEPQWKMSLDITDTLGKVHHITNYWVDFRVTFADGHVELHEVKGRETEVWRLKRKMMEALYLPEHPGEEYVVIKDAQRSRNSWAQSKGSSNKGFGRKRGYMRVCSACGDQQGVYKSLDTIPATCKACGGQKFGVIITKEGKT